METKNTLQALPKCKILFVISLILFVIVTNKSKMIVKKKTNCKKRYKTKRSVIIKVVFVYKEACVLRVRCKKYSTLQTFLNVLYYP